MKEYIEPPHVTINSNSFVWPDLMKREAQHRRNSIIQDSIDLEVRGMVQKNDYMNTKAHKL
jgi:hypothetical protein